MSDSDVDIDVGEPERTPPRKRNKIDYQQTYKDRWGIKWKWIQKSKKGIAYAWCKSCCCDILISRGIGEIKKHETTAKHVKSTSALKMQSSVQQLFERQSKNIDQKAKEGVIRFAAFITEHNLSMRLMEHLPTLVKNVCTDSEIAKSIKCGRTKITNVIKNVTGEEAKLQLFELLKANKFSLIADESTDRTCSKHMCLIARVANNYKVEDHFLALLRVQEATGAALFNLIEDFFNKSSIPYKENLIGFAADGANNMMGAHNSLASRLKEMCPDIFLLKCICHSFHLCASYACEKLPSEVEQLAREVYNFFSNSPKRVDQYKEFQTFANVAPHKLLHPSQTRWLSLESVVKRLISQYNALKLYFTQQAYENVLQADVILEKLNKPYLKLYLDFLAYVLPFFNKLNLIMQSEKPQIHKIFDEVVCTLKMIMECYMKPEKINNVYEVDYKNPRNFLDINEMYFGASINSSQVDKNVLHSVKIKCLDFYIESTKQILLRLPLKDSIIEKIQFIDPKIVKSKKIFSISDVAVLFPNLIKHEDIQDLDNEWRLLRNFPMEDIDNDVLSFWTEIGQVKIGDDSFKFLNLVRFVFQLLTLPHSSAAVERIFSQINLIKTQYRNKLKTKTVSGILHTKSLIAGKNCYDFPLNKNLISKLAKSDLVYSKDSVSSSSDSDDV